MTQSLTGVQIGCGALEPFRFSPASRDNSENQTFGQIRQGQSLTRDQRIAVEEHRLFHEAHHTFTSQVRLENHITLMILGIKNGLAFLEAHKWALENGGTP